MQVLTKYIKHELLKTAPQVPNKANMNVNDPRIMKSIGTERICAAESTK